MILSYWDKSILSRNYDLIVIGAGFSGCFAALFYAQSNPGSRIGVISRNLYECASRRNAGFLCYGSLSEIKADNSTGWPQLVKRRYDGIRLMMDTLGPENIKYKPCGGREYFTSDQAELYHELVDQIDEYNGVMKELVGCTKNFWENRPSSSEQFIDMPLEGAIQPAMAHNRLLRLCVQWGVNFITDQEVVGYEQEQSDVHIHLRSEVTLRASAMIIATNGFSTNLTSSKRYPVRNQVIVTQSIKHNLEQYVYHHDEGYIYYRPLAGGQILIGGARNQFMEQSNTDQLQIDTEIEKHLLDFLQTHITEGVRPEIHSSWSGILAMDGYDSPRARAIQSKIIEISGMNGMGVALSSITGLEASRLAQKATRL